MSIPEFSSPNSPEAIRAMRKLPTLVVESAKGQILLLRASEGGGGSTFWLHVHWRPLPANLPFHPADEGYEEPGDAVFSPIETAAALSDRFAGALERQDLRFVGPAELAALRTELHDYLEVRVTQPLDKPTRKAIQKAIDQFVPRNLSGSDCYLRFRDHFDALKWQLWTATERRGNSLPVDQRIRSNQLKAQQRDWMRLYILNLARGGANGLARRPQRRTAAQAVGERSFRQSTQPVL